MDPLPPMPPRPPMTAWEIISYGWAAGMFLFLLVLWGVTAFDLDASWLKGIGL